MRMKYGGPSSMPQAPLKKKPAQHVTSAKPVEGQWFMKAKFTTPGGSKLDLETDLPTDVAEAFITSVMKHMGGNSETA